MGTLAWCSRPRASAALPEGALVGFWESRTNLEGKCAIVLGGAEGIGAEVALELARAGVEVALCDLADSALADTAEELERLGRLRLAQVVDVRDLDALSA